MDALKRPTFGELVRVLGGMVIGLGAIFVGVFLCLMGAATSPGLEPLFFWLAIGTWSLVIAVAVRGKVLYAKSHHADGSGPSAYDARVERRARLLGRGFLCGWTILTSASILAPQGKLYFLAFGFICLVATLVRFAIDERNHARDGSP